MIKIVYFAFTSLSTVGFGDFHPKNDVERLLVALMLLFGVSIFTYIMGKFIEMIVKIQEFYATFEDDENLAKFMSILQHFNKAKPLN